MEPINPPAYIIFHSASRRPESWFKPTSTNKPPQNGETFRLRGFLAAGLVQEPCGLCPKQAAIIYLHKLGRASNFCLDCAARTANYSVGEMRRILLGDLQKLNAGVLP